MQRKAISSPLAAATIVAAIAFGCSKSGTGTGGSTATAGQDTILVNIGNNIILPGYQALSSAVNSLDSAITDFNAGPSATRLANVQGLFKTAYLAWVSVSPYNYFGPAADAQPVLSGLNVFPASTTQMESNISTGNTNVNTFANTAAKGFPALDYLLFGGGANGLAWYTDGRKAYLAAVAADIKAEVGAVTTGWGSYLTTFINGKGNSVSSSLGLLINSLDQDVEITKNDRLGIPLGLIPVGTTSPVQPKEVEAYYSGLSAGLAVAQVRAVEGILLGNGRGLINYVATAGARYGNGLLSDTIKAAIALDIQDLQAVADPLAQTIQSSPGAAEAAFAQTQRLVALLKTDMPSALGVLITYGDNDGD